MVNHTNSASYPGPILRTNSHLQKFQCRLFWLDAKKIDPISTSDTSKLKSAGFVADIVARKISNGAELFVGYTRLPGTPSTVRNRYGTAVITGDGGCMVYYRIVPSVRFSLPSNVENDSPRPFPSHYHAFPRQCFTYQNSTLALVNLSYHHHLCGRPGCSQSPLRNSGNSKTNFMITRTMMVFIK